MDGRLGVMGIVTRDVDVWSLNICELPWPNVVYKRDYNFVFSIDLEKPHC